MNSLGGMIGNFQHSMDAKGRLFLPAKHRERLGQTVYFTYGFDECLMLFPEEQWEKFEEAMNNLPLDVREDATRYYLGHAGTADVDGQGRVAIPQNLRQYAGLEKEVTFAGIGGYMEIWNTSKWEEKEKTFNKADIKSRLFASGFKF